MTTAVTRRTAMAIGLTSATFAGASSAFVRGSDPVAGISVPRRTPRRSLASMRADR